MDISEIGQIFSCSLPPYPRKSISVPIVTTALVLHSNLESLSSSDCKVTFLCHPGYQSLIFPEVKTQSIFDIAPSLIFKEKGNASGD
ncbi:hypothetical protein L345_03486 [Ophiophagus hannah]|uniref:Uncharacterized protein n=1 Tax=Ophiophagus hannah TaxID=8665 RepID=V8P9Q0_OPHHA|nr:hypothetical protein L345_03486 [Ophiophagus hannah]